MINFPINPSVGDHYQFQNKVWEWDGVKWKLYSVPGSGIGYQLVNGPSQFVLNANGTVTFNDGTVQSTAYTGNANGQVDLSGYQTIAGLSANVAKLAANNSLYLGGVAANQYAYANQVGGSYTLPTANTSTLGGVKVDGTTVTIANGVISSPNQDLSSYQTTTGLSANVATLTSNNTVYLGGVAANQYAYANLTVSQLTGTSGNVVLYANGSITFPLNRIDSGANSIALWSSNQATVVWRGEGGAGLPLQSVMQSMPGYVNLGTATGILGGATSTYNWKFDTSGVMTFPDNTTQNTAWTGSVATLTSNNTLYLGGVAANQYGYSNTLSTTISAANTVDITSTSTTGNNYFNFIPTATTGRHGFSVNDGTRFTELLLMKSTQTGYGLANEAVLRSSSQSTGLRLVGGGTTPRIIFATGISTSTTTDQFRINNTANAVNYLAVTGGVTGSAPSLTATGTDTDIDVSLIAKGAGSVTATGPLKVTYTPASTTGFAITATGKDSQGGTGYFDFLRATNTTTGATNPNKTFRLSSAGAIEIINSAYTATLMSLSDTGQMSTTLPYQVAGKQAVNGPAFRAYIATGQAITSGSQQKVTFGTESFDTDGCFTSSRFTPTLEGYYQLNATVRIDGPASTGECMIILYKNGTEYARGNNQSGTEQGSSFYSMQVSDIAYANGTGDYFEIYIQQTSGSNRNTTAGAPISYFSGCMMRGA